MKVAGQGIGGDDDAAPALDLDGAVAAGGADEFPDWPAGPVLDPPADGPPTARPPKPGPRSSMP